MINRWTWVLHTQKTGPRPNTNTICGEYLAVVCVTISVAVPFPLLVSLLLLERLQLMSCCPTVLSIRLYFPPKGTFWECELSIYLFKRTAALFWQRPPCCVWKLIWLFIPALTPKATVTCWAASLLPWDKLSHQLRDGQLLSAELQLWPECENGEHKVAWRHSNAGAQWQTK